MEARSGRAPLLLVALLAIPARGNFAGSDDFNDNSTDASKWGPGYTFQATVTEQNGRVEFLSPASYADIAHQAWLSNFDSYNSNWSVLIDYSNTPPQPGFGRDGVGLQIYNAANTADSVEFESYRYLNQNGYFYQVRHTNSLSGQYADISFIPGSSTG